MKKLIYLLLILSSISNISFAQNFVNGGLEPTISSYGCQAMLNTSFYGGMKQSGWSLGTYGLTSIDMLYMSCIPLTPHEGSYYVGLKADSVKTNMLILKLNADLLANNTYAVSFYQSKMQYGYDSTATGIVIGYTNDSTIPGTLVDSSSKPTSFAWEQKTINITPPVNTKYITVRAKFCKPCHGNYTALDDMSVSHVTGINSIEADKAIQLYPNPVSDILQINGAIKGTIFRITDITGRVVRAGKTEFNKEQIDISQLISGLYFIAFTYPDNKKFVQTIIKE